ncbi:hypothetical protein IAT40_005332 [Kwoniella sp. CBS 6097]
MTTLSSALDCRHDHTTPVATSQHTQTISVDSISTVDAPTLVSPTTPPLRAISPSHLAAPLPIPPPHLQPSSNGLHPTSNSVHGSSTGTGPSKKAKTTAAKGKAKSTINQGSRFPAKTNRGERQCTNCGEIDTPQWRGTLCNACALWKRSRGTDRPLPLLFPRRRTPTPSPSPSPSPSLSPSPPLLGLQGDGAVSTAPDGKREDGREEDGIEGLLALGSGAGAGSAVRRRMQQGGENRGYWQKKTGLAQRQLYPAAGRADLRPHKELQSPAIQGEPRAQLASKGMLDHVRGRMMGGTEVMDYDRSHRATSLQPRSRSRSRPRPPSISSTPQLAIRLPPAGSSLSQQAGAHTHTHTHAHVHAQPPLTARKEGVHSTPVSPTNRNHFPLTTVSPPGPRKAHQFPGPSNQSSSSTVVAESQVTDHGRPEEVGEMSHQGALSTRIATIMAQTQTREARHLPLNHIQTQQRHQGRSTISVSSPSTTRDTTAVNEDMSRGAGTGMDLDTDLGTNIGMGMSMGNSGSADRQSEWGKTPTSLDPGQAILTGRGCGPRWGVTEKSIWRGPNQNQNQEEIGGDSGGNKEKRSPYLPYSLDKRPRYSYRSSLGHQHQKQISESRLEILLASQRGTGTGTGTGYESRSEYGISLAANFESNSQRHLPGEGEITSIPPVGYSYPPTTVQARKGGETERAETDAETETRLDKRDAEGDKVHFMRSAEWLFDILESAAEALRPTEVEVEVGIQDHDHHEVGQSHVTRGEGGGASAHDQSAEHGQDLQMSGEAGQNNLKDDVEAAGGGVTLKERDSDDGKQESEEQVSTGSDALPIECQVVTGGEDIQDQSGEDEIMD